jgi:hypothetical protein
VVHELAEKMSVALKSTNDKFFVSMENIEFFILFVFMSATNLPFMTVLNGQIFQRIQKPEYLKKPNDNSNDGNCIQNIFDLSVHGDIRVYQP